MHSRRRSRPWFDGTAACEWSLAGQYRSFVIRTLVVDNRPTNTVWPIASIEMPKMAIPESLV